MTNIQVTHDLWQNARSESYITINPNNSQQMVTGSKKFRDIYNYDFTIATSYSSDGGHTWYPSQDLKIPGWAGISDPALTFDDTGHVYLVGLAFTNPPKIDCIGIAVYKSTDGGATWGEPKLIHASQYDDKQWAAADNDIKSPYRGRVYAVWDDDWNEGGLCFARTLDHGKSWIGTGTNPAGKALDTAGKPYVTANETFPEISVAADGKGTIYIIWRDEYANKINMLVSTDGGDSFYPSKEPPAKDIVRLESTEAGLQTNYGYAVFPNGTFRVYTLPTACTGPLLGQVMVAWADYREGVSRIYYARSENGGDSWITGPTGQPLLTGALAANRQHFHPQVVMKANGVVGCAFYEFGAKPTDYLIDVIMASSVDGNMFSYYTVTDQPWDPALDAPYCHLEEPPYITSDITFIGEYFGLDATEQGFYPLWTDTRTGVQELWVNVPMAVASVGPPGPQEGPPARPKQLPMTLQEWIVGLIDDSSGWIIPPKGSPKPGPQPYEPTTDILLGIASYRIATLVTSKEGTGLQKAALNVLASLVQKQLQRLEDNA
jgi:hypothetical protein